jgi:7-carboxy-7-deazaguanine synthase
MNEPRLPAELRDLGAEELLLSETFFSIQGESSFVGQPCFFIRLTGCHLRCVWCDSAYAFFDGRKSTVDECVRLAAESGSHLVEVTGGEPLLQRSVYPLLARLCDAGHEVLLETSGAVPIDRVDPRVRRIVDWKTPASGEHGRNNPGVIDALGRGDELKLVITDAADYRAARDWILALRERRPDIGTEIPVHFSPVFGRCRYDELATWILADRLPVRFGVQLHKHIWSPETRGV